MKSDSVSATKNLQASREEKIKAPEKIAYFMANMGNIPIMVVIGSYLLIFYTDVVKLDPATVGLLFLLARIADAFFDPMIGYVIDHLPKTKWGRFRPWLALGSFVCSINFLVLWLGPSMAVSGKLVIAYISYLLLGPTFATMDISLNSLLPSMTNSNKERNSLSSVKGFGVLLGATIVSVIVVPFVQAFPTQKEGYHALIIILSIAIFVFSFVGACGVRERVEPTKVEKYPLSSIFKIIFHTKPLMVVFLSGVFSSLGMMIRQGATMYYLTYNIKKPELMVTLGLISLVGSMIGIMLAGILANKFEKKIVIMGSFLVCGIGALLLFPASAGNIPYIIITSLINAIGSGGFMMLVPAITADTIDYAEWKHGYRTEATVVSLNSFITKFGQAIAGAIPAFILSATGYVRGEQTQHASTLLGINITMSVLPFIFLACGALLYMAYPLSKDMHKTILAELEKRRAS